MKINIVSKMLHDNPPRGHVAINDGADDSYVYVMIAFGPTSVLKTEEEAMFVALSASASIETILNTRGDALQRKSPQQNKIVDMAAKHSPDDAESFFDYIAIQKRIEELENRAAEIEKSIKPREDQFLSSPRWP